VFGRAFAERAFPVTTLRPPHILGQGKALGCDPLAQREMRLPEIIANGEPLRLLNEGMLLVQPVWNREVGLCIAHIAGNAKTLGQTYNCAGGECVTTRRYYEIIADQLSAELQFESMSLGDFAKEWPAKAHLCRHRAYDLRALREATGYEPRLPLEKAKGGGNGEW
jgi:nucleoside-diphosphate-sugar epimerase